MSQACCMSMICAAKMLTHLRGGRECVIDGAVHLLVVANSKRDAWLTFFQTSCCKCVRDSASLVGQGCNMLPLFSLGPEFGPPYLGLPIWAVALPSPSQSFVANDLSMHRDSQGPQQPALASRPLEQI